MLNRQLLGHCDFLFAIFHSHIGTPTDTHISGTVEEIDEFTKLHGGENVSIFFCEWGFPGTSKAKSLAKLESLSGRLGKSGIYVSVKKEADFEATVRHHLELKMAAFATELANWRSYAARINAICTDLYHEFSTRRYARGLGPPRRPDNTSNGRCL